MEPITSWGVERKCDNVTVITPPPKNKRDTEYVARCHQVFHAPARFSEQIYST